MSQQSKAEAKLKMNYIMRFVHQKNGIFMSIFINTKSICTNVFILVTNAQPHMCDCTVMFFILTYYINTMVLKSQKHIKSE